MQNFEEHTRKATEQKNETEECEECTRAKKKKNHQNLAYENCNHQRWAKLMHWISGSMQRSEKRKNEEKNTIQQWKRKTIFQKAKLLLYFFHRTQEVEFRWDDKEEIYFFLNFECRKAATIFHQHNHCVMLQNDFHLWHSSECPSI